MAEAQNNFRRRHPSKSGRGGIPYPLGLEEIVSFAQWFEEVKLDMERVISVPDDVQDSSKLPSAEAKTFKSMYAYGYHFQVKSAKQSMKSTFDSGVVAVFRQSCRFTRQDQNPITRDLEYVGQILKIVELNYRRHCVVLFVCDWVKANYRGRNATLKKDKWDFTMANFQALVPFGYESFAFPIHGHQVFFSDNEEDLAWEVVLRTEVRGRRHDIKVDEGEELVMFSMGRDSGFMGMQVEAEVAKTYLNPLLSGITIPIHEPLNESVEENPTMFDKDTGESSEDED